MRRRQETGDPRFLVRRSQSRGLQPTGLLVGVGCEQRLPFIIGGPQAKACGSDGTWNAR